MKKMKLVGMLIIAIVMSCDTQYPDLDSGLYADLETNKGNVILRLEMEKTPITVANFVSLSEGDNTEVAEEFKGKKYYNGLLFHRVLKDFMVQGGDPTGIGTGGPGYRFDDEFTDLTHSDPGILSMANSGPATNGSQFFITYKETSWLNGKHTVFGKVVKGQEVVDSIAQNDTIKKITIIRKGSDALSFDAPEVFSSYFANKAIVEKEKAEKSAALIKETVARFENQKSQATTTASGLQYFISEKGTGAKVSTTDKALTHYAVYFADGVVLETSILKTAEALGIVDENKKAAGQYQPIPADVGAEARMIEGFKEGLKLLSAGDKATLFLPYDIAYGENGNGGIPPKSDLVFEVEIVELIK